MLFQSNGKVQLKRKLPPTYRQVQIDFLKYILPPLLEGPLISIFCVKGVKDQFVEIVIQTGVSLVTVKLAVWSRFQLHFISFRVLLISRWYIKIYRISPTLSKINIHLNMLSFISLKRRTIKSTKQTRFSSSKF